MKNRSAARSAGRAVSFLQQQEQERLTKMREQIFRRHEWERLEHDRRRVATHLEKQGARVVVARCPTCGELLE